MQQQPGQSTPPVQYIPAAQPQPQAERQGCGGCGCFGRLLLVSLLLLAVVVFAGTAAVGGLVYADWSSEIEEGVVQLESARERETFETTQILDRNGNVLWEIFGEGKRTNIPLAEVPQHLIQATVSVEDDSYYENIGLDAPSLVAALIANLRNPDARPVGAAQSPNRWCAISLSTMRSARPFPMTARSRRSSWPGSWLVISARMR